MVIPLTSFIIMILGTLLGIAFIVILLLGRKYDEYIKSLNSKEFPLCELYGFGLAILEIINYSYSSKSERDRRKDIQLIYGEKYSEYYLSIIAAQRITISTLVAIGGFVLYGLSSEVMVLIVMLMFAFASFIYYGDSAKREIAKRSKELIGDFSEMVSKLALLINAGMILKEAWQRVAEGGDGLIYEEMHKAIVDMDNNMPEMDAYLQFSHRCVVPEIKKFTSMIVQGLVKGNKELSFMMKEQSKEIWTERQERVRQQGEKAASKLLIPISIMFIGILIMIVVPIFANLGVS